MARDPQLIARAREMRSWQTEPETRLWFALRARRFAHVKFRRQKVIGPYIVDFAALEPMLVVELDGDSHAGRESYDARRSTYLESLGYRVMRFSNRDVLTNLEGVLELLALALGTSPLPTLSPEGERALRRARI